MASQNQTTMNCLDPSKLHRWKAIWGDLVKMDEQELYEETGCMARCKRREWTISKIFDKKSYLQNDSQIMMLMFYANGRYQEGKQYYTYDFNSFLSDLGGYLGLLLGYSIVSFFDMAQDILTKFIRRGEKPMKVID